MKSARKAKTVKANRMTRICLDCNSPVAGKDDAIPGTGRKGSVYWCVRHESERIKKISMVFHNVKEANDVA